MKFKVIIHPEPEGGFWGEVPALTGCYSQGETIAELMTNLQQAAIGCYEVLLEEGRSPERDVEIAELAI
jgi:predicted RNase H-like HicB family nuclease